MAGTWKKLAYYDDVIPKTTFTAKGDLLAGTGNGTLAKLTVGADGQMLYADSNETGGVKWAAAPAGGDFKADGTVAMAGDLNFAGHKATDMAFHNVADATARNALTPVLGKTVFQVDESAPYICTAIA